MSDTTVTPAHSIIIDDQRTMFGKRTGRKVATLTGAYGGAVETCEGLTAADAKSTMLAQLAKLADNARPSYVVCGDGITMLCVYRTFSGWAYDIIDAKRPFASGCEMSGDLSRKEAVKRAIDHADQSYNGTVNVLRGA